MEKPVVYYKKYSDSSIVVGGRASVSALNHPHLTVETYGADCLGGVWVNTSKVLSVEENGDFETLNSKYVLVADDYVPPHSH